MLETNPSSHLKAELANSITHGFGLIMSFIGVAVLLPLAVYKGSALHISACSIYGLSLILLYTSSTLYHSFQQPDIKRIFKILDHISIYVMIAGSYTPFLLLKLKGSLGWTFFIIMWSIVAFGAVFKILYVNRFKVLSLIIYLSMGWLVVFVAKPLFASLSSTEITWIVIGGLSYTLGTIFYAWNKYIYNHAIWHLFVLGGSISHFIAIMLILN